jgi:hypothetical protein
LRKICHEGTTASVPGGTAAIGDVPPSAAPSEECDEEINSPEWMRPLTGWLGRPFALKLGDDPKGPSSNVNCRGWTTGASLYSFLAIEIGSNPSVAGSGNPSQPVF